MRHRRDPGRRGLGTECALQCGGGDSRPEPVCLGDTDSRGSAVESSWPECAERLQGSPPVPSPASLRRGALVGCLRPSTATPWDTYGRRWGRPASCCFGRPRSCGAACGHRPAALQASLGTPRLSGPLRSAAELHGAGVVVVTWQLPGGVAVARPSYGRSWELRGGLRMSRGGRGWRRGSCEVVALCSRGEGITAARGRVAASWYLETAAPCLREP